MGQCMSNVPAIDKVDKFKTVEEITEPTSPTLLRARDIGEFLFAVAENREKQVLKLLDQGMSVNICDYDQRTALHIAAANGDPFMVNLLLATKADVKATDRWGQTPLDEAVRGRYSAIQTSLCLAGLSKGETTPPSITTASTKSNMDQLEPHPDNTPELETLLDNTPWGSSESFASLRQVSQDGHWCISSNEVNLGTKLGSTLKSDVYKATWHTTEVVVKKIKEPSEEMCAEMLHEIELLSKLRHPDLVLFLGASLEEELSFFVTEYMAGGDLDRYYKCQYAQTGKPYHPPWVTFMKWSGAVARALAFLHGGPHPIIHRDLKPMNLLLNSNQDLKVCDFGISKIMDQSRHSGLSAPAPPMSGGVGTWRFMAPEVVRWEQYNERADVYSFALIMWFMFTGSMPFITEFGKDAELVLQAHVRHEQPRPQINKRFKAGLGQLIEDCWQETPSTRPSASEASERLAELSHAKTTFVQAFWGSR